MRREGWWWIEKRRGSIYSYSLADIWGEEGGRRGGIIQIYPRSTNVGKKKKKKKIFKITSTHTYTHTRRMSIVSIRIVAK